MVLQDSFKRLAPAFVGILSYQISLCSLPQILTCVWRSPQTAQARVPSDRKFPSDDTYQGVNKLPQANEYRSPTLS